VKFFFFLLEKLEKYFSLSLDFIKAVESLKKIPPHRRRLPRLSPAMALIHWRLRVWMRQLAA
jgi:hypothetical protein